MQSGLTKESVVLTSLTKEITNNGVPFEIALARMGCHCDGCSDHHPYEGQDNHHG